jgi:hypothetical protein
VVGNWGERRDVMVEGGKNENISTGIDGFKF